MELQPKRGHAAQEDVMSERICPSSILPVQADTAVAVFASDRKIGVQFRAGAAHSWTFFRGQGWAETSWQTFDGILAGCVLWRDAVKPLCV
jgi:hypothetical protein